MDPAKKVREADQIAKAIVRHKQWRWGIGMTSNCGTIVWVTLAKIGVAAPTGSFTYYYRPVTGRELAQGCQVVDDLEIRLSSPSTQGLLLSLLLEWGSVEEVSFRREADQLNGLTEYLTVFMDEVGTTFTLEGDNRGVLLAAALLSIWDTGVQDAVPLST